MEIDKLRKLGLSPYEAKCYLALAAHGILPAKEIAKKSGVPPTSVYRNMESLKERGLVTPLQKEPLVYQILDPSVAIKELMRLHAEELDKIAEKTICEMKALKTPPAIKEEQIVSIGKAQSYKTGIELVKSAKQEMFIVGRGEKPGLIELSQQLMWAVRRGVDVKFITSSYEENKDIYSRLKKSGVKVKTLSINVTLLVMDSKESVIVIKAPQLKEERFALKISDQDFSRSLREYFLTLWKRAIPI